MDSKINPLMSYDKKSSAIKFDVIAEEGGPKQRTKVNLHREDNYEIKQYNFE
jgi:hypothetical protein